MDTFGQTVIFELVGYELTVRKLLLAIGALVLARLLSWSIKWSSRHLKQIGRASCRERV